jgi:hypothetical protein
LGHLYLFAAATTAGKSFDLYCYRGAPNFKNFRKAAYLVSNEDWALKAHRRDCDRDDSTICASNGDGAAGAMPASAALANGDDGPY